MNKKTSRRPPSINLAYRYKGRYFTLTFGKVDTWFRQKETTDFLEKHSMVSGDWRVAAPAASTPASGLSEGGTCTGHCSGPLPDCCSLQTYKSLCCERL